MPRYIQDRETGKLVEVTKRSVQRIAPAVIGDIEPFTSPVDGTVIGSRVQLRAHQQRHGVAQHAEYGENNGQAYFERAEKERHARRTFNTPQDRDERARAIAQAIDKHRR